MVAKIGCFGELSEFRQCMLRFIELGEPSGLITRQSGAWPGGAGPPSASSTSRERKDQHVGSIRRFGGRDGSVGALD